MIESADADDKDYLLRHLDRTVVRVRASTVVGGVRPPPGSLEETILGFVREHPGVTVPTLWERIPRLHERDYGDVQRLIVGMIDERTLERAGLAPLETVDPRYERVPRCDLCGAASDTHPILFWKHNTPVAQCNDCGLIYANPRWQVVHLAPRYEGQYWAEYAAKVTAHVQDPALQAWWQGCLHVLAGGRGPGRLLDVGRATGEFLATARVAGWAGYGIEIAAEAAAHAEQIAQAVVHVGTLDTAPWPDGWFDAVTLWDVIEHLPSPRAALAQVARLVRPGGMIVLTTPNIRSLSYARWGRTWPVIGPNEHLYYFAPRTLARLLTNSGFAIHAMVTLGPTLETWQQMLPFPQAQPLIARLHPGAQFLARRFLVGDELQVFARRVDPTSTTQPGASGGAPGSEQTDDNER